MTMGTVERNQVPALVLSGIGYLRPNGGTIDEIEGPEHDTDGLEISAVALSHAYDGPSGEVPVLADLTVTVPRDGYAALVGPSGAGKTTLLSLIGGLEPVQTGTLRVGGHDVAALAGDDLAAYRRTTVGFIFQNFGLLDALTALENVELAAMLAGERPAQRRARAAELLDAVGMSPRAAHRPGALSGGERQRVAIARALVNGPRLVLADEPTGNLDTDTSEEVMVLLESMRRERGCTLLVVTHDRGLARRANQLLVLDRGRIRDTFEPDSAHHGSAG
jgi:putative ABC transport system ATP-binding protein